MKLGLSLGGLMGLKTRLDGRSEDNDKLLIKNSEDEILAEISLVDPSGITLNITTKEGLYVEKPNGWNSKGNK